MREPDKKPSLRLPAFPVPTVAPEQLAAVAANFAPLAKAMREAAQQLGEAHVAMARNLVSALSAPRGQDR